MNINLKLELDVRLDGKEKVYYISRIKFPGIIDLSRGATFLIFLSDSGGEELQIACNDKDNTTYNKYSKKNNKLKVALDSRVDKHKAKYFVAKLHYDGYIDCSKNEAAFMVFTSKEGYEELQISGDIISNTEKLQPISEPTGRKIEVYYK